MLRMLQCSDVCRSTDSQAAAAPKPAPAVDADALPSKPGPAKRQVSFKDHPDTPGEESDHEGDITQAAPAAKPDAAKQEKASDGKCGMQ